MKKEGKIPFIIDRFVDKRFGSYALDTVSLFKSVLGPDGPKYEKLYERKAGGA